MVREVQCLSGNLELIVKFSRQCGNHMNMPILTWPEELHYINFHLFEAPNTHPKILPRFLQFCT